MCILPMLERGEGVQEVIAAMTLDVYITNVREGEGVQEVIAAMTLYVYITNVREGGGSPGGYSCNDPVCVYYQC